MKFGFLLEYTSRGDRATINPNTGGPLWDSLQEWERDVATHVLRMRWCLRHELHIRSHGEIIFGDVYHQLYNHEMEALVEHLGLDRWPHFIARHIVNPLLDHYVKRVVHNIIEREGYCPEVHSEAQDGIADLENLANGDQS
jgi:hypothetical protein